MVTFFMKNLKNGMLFQAEDGWFSRKCKKINHSTSKLSFMVPSFLNFSFVDDGMYC